MRSKLDHKDAVIIMLIILCFALIIFYSTLSTSYNTLADLYMNYCYMQPSAQMYADSGINFMTNVTGLIVQ
jgi:hypothetical protein